MPTSGSAESRVARAAEAACGKSRSFGSERLVAQRAVVGQRLLLEDVERRPGDPALAQRLRERHLVHHRPAGGVHEVRGLLHQPQPRLVDQVEGRLRGRSRHRQRHVQRDEVGPPQRVLERDDLDRLLPRREPLAVRAGPSPAARARRSRRARRSARCCGTARPCRSRPPSATMLLPIRPMPDDGQRAARHLVPEPRQVGVPGRPLAARAPAPRPGRACAPPRPA